MTADRRRSALLANAVSAGPIAQLAIKGFKEGDRITRVLDLRVRSDNGQTITVDRFDADGVGFPPGSIVRPSNGLWQALLAEPILRGARGLTEITLSGSLPAVDCDFVTVFDPFPMTVTAVDLSGADNAQRVMIEPYEIDGTLSDGTLFATLDNAVRQPLAAPISIKGTVHSVSIQAFHENDEVTAVNRDGERLSSSSRVKRVQSITDIVYLDDNFLVYPGVHRLTMEGA